MKNLRRFLSAIFIAVVIVTNANAAPPPEGFADLIDKLMPSVVNIATRQTVKMQTPQMQQLPEFPEGSPFNDLFKDFMDRYGQGQNPNGNETARPITSLGSGFIIDASGYIVTNNHVIADAESINVILHDDTEIEAKVIGTDSKTDLALIKIETKKPLVPLQWGDSDKMRVGDWILAIGNPFGLGGTVTAGIVSARARDINSGPYDDFIQTDASINRGNSGGPMFNMAGEVVGVNSAIYSPSGGSVGIGFAIPTALAKPVIEQLKAHGHTRRGWIGVRIQEVTKEIAEGIGLPDTKGALVAEVSPGGPSAKAGIEQGDVIIKFDGKSVDHMRQLPRIVADTEIGKAVDIEFIHKGKTKTAKIKLGELEAAEKAMEAPASKVDAAPKSDTGVETMGLTLSDIAKRHVDTYKLKTAKGVVITHVDPKSEAAEKGIQPGDIIIEVAQEKVESAAAAKKQLDKAIADKKPSVLLLVDRAGENRYVAIKIESKKK